MYFVQYGTLVALKHEWCNNLYTLPWQRQTVKAPSVKSPSEETIVQVCVCLAVFSLSDHKVRQQSLTVSGWCHPPSVAESGEGVNLDGVLEGRSEPGVGQTHSHLQVHLQLQEKDSEDGGPLCLWQKKKASVVGVADPPCLGCSGRPSVSL